MAVRGRRRRGRGVRPRHLRRARLRPDAVGRRQGRLRLAPQARVVSEINGLVANRGIPKLPKQRNFG